MERERGCGELQSSSTSTTANGKSSNSVNNSDDTDNHRYHHHDFCPHAAIWAHLAWAGTVEALENGAAAGGTPGRG